MAKRNAKGRQQLRSSKNMKQNASKRNDNEIDWEITSEEGTGSDYETAKSAPSSDNEEDVSENLETVEEKRLRLAKQYLDTVRMEEEESESDVGDETDEEGVEERIEKRLQREDEEARGNAYKEVATSLKEAVLPEGHFHKGHMMPVTCTDISGDEKYIVSGGKDCRACLWDVEAERIVTIFEGKRERKESEKRKLLNVHRGEVLAVQISQDGKYVVTAGKEGLIRIWDSRCGSVVGEEGVQDIMPVTTRIKHVTDCKEVLRGHRGVITSLLLQKDNILYSGGLDTTVKLWNIVDSTYIDTLYGHENEITCLAGMRNTLSSRNNTRIISCGTDNSLRLWKIEANTQMVFRGRRVDQSMECCAFSGSKHMITGDVNGTLNLFSMEKKKPIYSIKDCHGSDGSEKGVARWVTSCATLPFTNLLATGSYDDAIRLWDVNAFNRDKDQELIRLVKTIPVKGFVNSISISNSGRFLVCGIGQEHRLGRWWRLKGVKNGLYIQNLNVDLSV